MKKEIHKVYVDCGTMGEFNTYQKEHPELECLYIVDEIFLRGRVPGLIKRIGTFERRWNYGGITESIENAFYLWKDFFQQKEIEEELGRTDLTEEDLQYGID